MSEPTDNAASWPPLCPTGPLPEPDGPAICARGEDWLVTLKPRGLLTVPDRAGTAPSLWAWLRDQDVAGRTIGRLDRAAGGLSLWATSAAAQRRLDAAWRAPATQKVYLARTLAPPTPATAVVDAPIGPGRKGAMRLGEGKAARTEVAMLGDDNAGGAWVACRLYSGRRHQIRLHLASLGAPIAGDTRYARAAARLGGYAGPAPAPTPAARIDLWCVHLSVPDAGIDVRWPGGVTGTD